MNWNRPNNGYEREPWDRPAAQKKEKRITSLNWFNTTPKKKDSVMTEEQRRRIQALRNR